MQGFLGEKSECSSPLGGRFSRKSLGQRGWSPDSEPPHPSLSLSLGVLSWELGGLNKNVYLEKLSELHLQRQGDPLPHHLHNFPL